MAGRLVGFAGFVAWLGALSPVVALAQTAPRVALTWTAPAQCPASDAVVAEVDRILGESGARPTAPLAVDARVTGGEGTFVVEVRTTSADGPRSRSLRGKTCAAVADATALVIALAIDPNAVPPPPRPEAPIEAAPAPKPTPPAPKEPPPVAAPKESPKRDAPPPRPRPSARSIVPSYRLQAWGGGEVGALPAVTPSFGGEAGVVLASFRLMLGGEAFLSQTHLIQTKPNVGGSVGLGAGYLDVGYTFAPGAFELGPLAGFEIGSMYATSINAGASGSHGTLWDAARVGGFAGWFPIRTLGVFTHVEAAFPFTRPNFYIKPNTTMTSVHQPGSASGRLGVGVELRL